MSAFRTQINDDIGCQNDIQIVFDYYYRVSVVHQRLQYLNQLLNIRWVKPSGWFVQNIYSMIAGCLD